MTDLRLRGAALLALAMLVTTGLAACARPRPAATVTVLGPWAGTEQGTEGYAFEQILDAFEAETGIRVNYQDTRALLQVLRSDVQGGTPPDVAILSSPGELARYARTGDLYPLDGIVPKDRQEAFPRQWLLPRKDSKGTEHIYTVPVKANLKGLIWYNPAHGPRSPPQTWDDLLAFDQSVVDGGGTPWCMGMGDPPGSGWPGTDLIEDILLHRSGPEVYRRWAGNVQSWTSDEVRAAWEEWGSLATYPEQVHGGPHAVLLTDFQDAGRSLFDNQPGCYLDHEGSYIMSFYQNYPSTPKPGTGFDFFPFPSFDSRTNGPWEASADLAGMYRDTPQARRLMLFLASDKVQWIWANTIRGAFSVNRHADLNQYHDPVSRRIATVLATKPLCLDASDVMPAPVRTAFSRAVLEYLNNPHRLPDLLAKLEQVRLAIRPEDWVDLPCGR
jgi:alpha-glucoside transport system substrate-binding protein